MDTVAPRLPAVLGSTAALVVAFISFLVQVSPLVCVMRAVAAFVVFAAFGIVIRYLLADGVDQAPPQTPETEYSENDLHEIAPGKSVEELQAEQERQEARAGE